MPSNFTINPKPIKSSPLEQIQKSLLDEFALKTHLDFSQHFAHKKIDLFKQYRFDSANKFHCVVAADRARVLHLLAHMVRYNIIEHSKVNKHYAQ